ncbi:MAG: hypothetical protein SNF93_07760 [Rikenellaceae bacterium]
MKINYESDFKLYEQNEVEDSATPFRFRYKTSGISSYVAQFDGTDYTNCRRLDDGSLLVIFDDHKLPCGVLQVRREYFLTDEDFADGVCNRVTQQTLDVRLTDGESDDDSTTVEVYPTYQKGDTFTFEDLTEEQIAQLTPVKGVDYFTQEDIESMSEIFLTKGDVELDNLLAYGIEFNIRISTNNCSRIGNLSLHRSLPIQSHMRGCLLDDDGQVVEYLPEDTWVGSTRDGSLGQVMVEVPEHYIKFVSDGYTRQVWISEFALAGYTKVPKMYIGAYEASINRTSTTLASVVNTTEEYRGCNNTSTYDNTYRSQLGRAVSNMASYYMRAYTRKRKSSTTEWNCYSYHAHRAIYWLFTVEYATLNSQEAINTALTTEGYRQGGLGNGATTLAEANWYYFNEFSPFIPCGHTDSLGNSSGEVVYTVYDETNNFVISTYANRYRGIENPFGHIQKWIDGVVIDIRSDSYSGLYAGESRVFIAEDYASFTAILSLNDNGYSNYYHAGNLSRDVSSFIREIALGDNGDIFATSCSGSSSTYYCDILFSQNTVSQISGVSIGGTSKDGEYAGLTAMNTIYAPSYGQNNTGTRICFHPNE